MQYRRIYGLHERICHRYRLSLMQSPQGLCYGNIIPHGSGARRTEMAMYPSARVVRLPGTSAPPATRASRATVLFLASFTVYWPIALACDSAGGGLPGQAVIGGLTWLFLAAAIW